MKNPPINLKPSVLAVSAVLGLLVSSHSMATTTTIISTSVPDISNSGSYESISITNAGSITGSAYGVYNSGSIGTLANDGFMNGSYYAVYNNSGTISTLTNTGSITGLYDAIVNDGSIGTLNNSGTIANTPNAIYNYEGTIGTLINSGTLSSTSFAVMNYYSSIGSLSNSGFISGDEYAIYNGTATLSSLTNSGTISSSGYAIYNDAGGVLGPITNSGTILGDIYSSTSLTIAGGSNSPGVLSGYTESSISTTSPVGNITIASGDLVLNSGYLFLNDNVTVSGAVKNTGTTLYIFSPVTINGNYTQSASASLNSFVFSETSYAQLVVNGNASIASGSSVNLVSLGYSFATGQRYVVIKATSSDYNASSLNYSATGYTGSITGSTVTDTTNSSYSDLVLTLGSTTTTNTAQATTPNAVASLNGLQRYSGTSNAALLNLYDASLAISSTAEGNKAGEQLSPNQNASASSATSSATFDMINVIGNHLGNVDSIKVAQGNGSSGLSAGDDAPQQAGWGQIFGGHASQGMTNDISGYHANYTGAVVGYDRAVTDNWRAGGAFSYTYTNVHGTDNVQGSNSRVESYGLTAYASYVAPKWYSNLYAAVLDQRYTTQRQVSFTGYNGVANGSFDGQQYAFKAEFGYPIALPRNLILTPIANVSYSYLHQNGYTESGGNGAALQVDSAHSDAIKSGLGAKLETTLSTRWGDVVPYAQLLWNHQYNRSRMAVTAAYAADTSETSFTSLGSSPVKDAADLTLGATLLRSRNTSLTAYYDVAVASHYTNQSLSLRIKQLF